MPIVTVHMYILYSIQNFLRWSFSTVVISDYEHFPLSIFHVTYQKVFSAAPSKKRWGCLADRVLDASNQAFLARAVFASLASSSTDFLSCLMSVMFFYSGGEGLCTLLSQLSIEAISHHGCFWLWTFVVTKIFETGFLITLWKCSATHTQYYEHR